MRLVLVLTMRPKSGDRPSPGRIPGVLHVVAVLRRDPKSDQLGRRS